MRRVAFYLWLLPSDTKPGKKVKSRWRMTDEEAKRYPGAERLDDTVEWRDLPSEPGEAGWNQYNGGKA
jgi:hypothetical protein